MNRVPFVLASVLLAGMGLAAPVVAQEEGVEPSLAILPTAAEGVSDPDVALVEARAASGFAEAGYRVIDRAETARQARRRRVTCADLACAAQVSEALAVTWVLRARLWSSGSAIRQVVLRVVDANGVAHEGAGEVTVAGSLEVAVDAAVADALAHIGGLIDPVTWYVHGTPIGAAVVIDGQPAGTLPWAGELTPGEHELVVSATGFDSIERTMQVTAGGRAVVELVRQSGDEEIVVDPPVVPTIERTRPWYSVAGPVAMGVLGLAALAVDVAALVDQGCRDVGPGGVCLSGRSIDEPPFAVWGVTGILAITGAIIWFALGEEDLPAGAAVTDVTVRLGAGSVAVTGRF